MRRPALCFAACAAALMLPQQARADRAFNGSYLGVSPPAAENGFASKFFVPAFPNKNVFVSYWIGIQGLLPNGDTVVVQAGAGTCSTGTCAFAECNATGPDCNGQGDSRTLMSVSANDVLDLTVATYFEGSGAAWAMTVRDERTGATTQETVSLPWWSPGTAVAAATEEWDPSQSYRCSDLSGGDFWSMVVGYNPSPGSNFGPPDRITFGWNSGANPLQILPTNQPQCNWRATPLDNAQELISNQ